METTTWQLKCYNRSMNVLGSVERTSSIFTKFGVILVCESTFSIVLVHFDSRQWEQDSHSETAMNSTLKVTFGRWIGGEANRRKRKFSPDRS